MGKRTEILGTIDLDWIKKNSYMYILDLRENKATAIQSEGEQSYSGVCLHKRWSKENGYYFDPETASTGKTFIQIGVEKGKHDITTSFEEAVELSEKHLEGRNE